MEAAVQCRVPRVWATANAMMSAIGVPASARATASYPSSPSESDYRVLANPWPMLFSHVILAALRIRS